MLAAQALIDDAFEVHFDSFEKLMSRPKLKDNVDWLPLQWKSEMLDQPILPLTYQRFWHIWKDTVRAAGYRDPLRPYAMRVGAGGRLDCKLFPRSHSLSMSTLR